MITLGPMEAEPGLFPITVVGKDVMEKCYFPGLRAKRCPGRLYGHH